MSRYAFFRQTGWMLVATALGGAFSFLVHPILTKPFFIHPIFTQPLQTLGLWRNPITGEEYGLFVALMAIVSLLNTPSNGLQSTLAYQTASAVTPEQARQLRGTVRRILQALFGIWLLVLLATLFFQSRLMTDFKIYHPASLWVTMLIGLPVLWLPVLSGILQGKQDFLWLGWQSILNSIGRCAAIFVIVRIMGVHVTGAMAGVLVGSCTSLAICVWQAWPVLRGPADPVDWKGWLRSVIPLTLGLGAAAFMLSADMIIVRRFFPEQSGLYSAVAVIGKALMFLVIPMTQVMFPKVVQAAARLERTDVMTQALAATGLIGAVAAIGCTLFPELPLKVLFDALFLPAKSLVGWYAWCILPVTLANVLINNLMARQHYRSVPWLVGIAIAYGVVLVYVADKSGGLPPLEAFRHIVLTLGVFSVLLFAVTIWFTIRKR
jgi:O-antigen/teichoic acid export membrane protein